MFDTKARTRGQGENFILGNALFFFYSYVAVNIIVLVQKLPFLSSSRYELGVFNLDLYNSTANPHMKERRNATEGLTHEHGGT